MHAAAIVLTLALAAPQDSVAPFDEKMREAEQFLKARQWEDALKAYKAANALQQKKSAVAHIGMARAYEGLRAYKRAADACTDALKYAGDDRRVQIVARNLRGTSLFALAQKPDDKRLKQAEEDFRTVLEMVERPHISQYNLGVVLLKQMRDAEGIQELERFIADAGSAPEVAGARRFIEDPRRAREPFAPDFSLTTLDGEYVSLESLKGKVVLIDFWATWCPPCLEATPGLARIQKRLDGEPFVLLGISADRNRDAWASFVRDNRLSWHHYLDQRRQLGRAFNIEVFPSYLLLDHDGIVRHTWAGWTPSTDGDIERKAKKLLKAVPR